MLLLLLLNTRLSGLLLLDQRLILCGGVSLRRLLLLDGYLLSRLSLDTLLLLSLITLLLSLVTLDSLGRLLSLVGAYSIEYSLDVGDIESDNDLPGEYDLVSSDRLSARLRIGSSPLPTSLLS